MQIRSATARRRRRRRPPLRSPPPRFPPRCGSSPRSQATARPPPWDRRRAPAAAGRASPARRRASSRRTRAWRGAAAAAGTGAAQRGTRRRAAGADPGSFRRDFRGGRAPEAGFGFVVGSRRRQRRQRWLSTRQPGQEGHAAAARRSAGLAQTGAAGARGDQQTPQGRTVTTKVVPTPGSDVKVMDPPNASMMRFVMTCCAESIASVTTARLLSTSADTAAVYCEPAADTHQAQAGAPRLGRARTLLDLREGLREEGGGAREEEERDERACRDRKQGSSLWEGSRSPRAAQRTGTRAHARKQEDPLFPLGSP